jgi:hypothetical protein
MVRLKVTRSIRRMAASTAVEPVGSSVRRI